MGTVVTVCMLIGLLAGVVTLIWPRYHSRIVKVLGMLVLLAGGWNVFWYWLRHPTEHWGLAALASGMLMMLTALYLIVDKQIPSIFRRLKPVVLVLLAAILFYYANTIYHL